MAKDKERSMNPAAAQRKQDKQKSLKKGKAEALARRNEKLARRNPDRMQRQINDLKSLEESGQQLRPHDKEVLKALEQDLRAVLKAREALGDKAPKFSKVHHGDRREGGDAVLGKRRRDGGFSRFAESGNSETDEDVRQIPMPRDTPPPIPRQQHRKRGGDGHVPQPEHRGPHALPSRPPAAPVKTVYEAKPEIRDLRQEAINKFIPAAVQRKQDSIKGQGKLLEPEEMDKLEKAGYKASGQAAKPVVTDEQLSLEEEERRFNQEMKKTVQIEEVEDEEA
ncbi:WW domain binding protein 11 [Penicillium capsulatum]|uniref:WW domain binding protein 11 n=1 Tax=Penicillium capsulatum TaxID=69766 RepID=A0A9W9IKA8_9EURO|nr:WW domain binding protein 11 [Penicillium capsulatum]KAJ6122126.1 WW domain binding protein 11 [Penicillium capsulatum]